ncbi:MAG: Na(+)/H(+) antiporter subunit D, partial [Pseudomonadota bacterium]
MRRVRQVLTIAAPLLGILMLTSAELEVNKQTFDVLGIELILYRMDSLSFIFALAFLIAAVLNAIYALHTD